MASPSEERVLDETILVASESEEYDLSESDEDDDSTAADEEPLPSNILMIGVTDALFAYFSRNFFVRELLQLTPVCRQFRALVPSNSVFTTRARRENDDSRDWFFPVHFAKVKVQPPPTPEGSSKRKRARSSWLWSGTHHPTGQTHTLPSLEHLPSGRIHFSDDLGSFRCLMSSSGSLLLFVLKQGNSWNHRFYVSHDEPSHWIPLLVSNPLTKEYRLLPQPANAKTSRWDYVGARVHIVEDEYARAYTVVVLCRDRALVYKSTTNCWSSSEFAVPLPQDVFGTQFIRDHLNIPYAIVPGGKILYADLEVNGNKLPTADGDDVREMLSKGGVRVLEVDYVAGTWKLAVRLALQDFIPNDLHYLVDDFGLRDGSFGIDMVTCNGGVYVLIPAILITQQSVTVKQKQIMHASINGGFNGESLSLFNVKTYQDYGILPIRFYVLKVKGDGLPFGQVLIQLPRGDYKKRTEEWVSDINIFYCPNRLAREREWYSARGWGSAIYIMVANCVLRYDVMSGTTTIQAMKEEILKDRRIVGDQPDVSYRPSLYMKP